MAGLSTCPVFPGYTLAPTLSSLEQLPHLCKVRTSAISAGTLATLLLPRQATVPILLSHSACETVVLGGHAASLLSIQCGLCSAALLTCKGADHH